MDLLVWARDGGVPAEELAPLVDLPAEDVSAAYWEIDRRRVATRYLHAPAVILDEQPGRRGGRVLSDPNPPTQAHTPDLRPAHVRPHRHPPD